MSEILSALQENWGVPTRVSSIRALLGLIERWSADVENEQLLESLSLSIEHFVTEELESASFPSEGLPPQASQLLGELTNQFQALTACLEELDEALAEHDVAEVTALASRIRTAAQKVGETGAALDDWMRDPDPCCLGCGGTEETEGWCPECGIELLVPNLTPDFTNVNVQLEPVFHAIYERYRAIGRGDDTVSSILQLLPAAEDHVLELGRAAKGVNRKDEDAEVREQLFLATEGVINALVQIEEATESKMKVDLDHAWQNTAKALLSMNDALGQLIENLGVERGNNDAGDQISLD
jgi:hypothetical protein